MPDTDKTATIGALANALLQKLDTHEKALVNAAMRAEPKRARGSRMEDLGAETLGPLQALAGLKPPRATLASKALIAGLCADRLQKFGAGLPARVRERSLETLAWLTPWLAEDHDETYAFPADAFVKDYRFATGLTVPCGAQVVDLMGRPGPKTALTLVSRNPRLAWQVLTRPWFRPHTESRYLDEFNEEGWNRCYHEVAALLRARPSVAGLVATSWFYDPELETISPRLSYLRSVPVSGGAVTVAHGSTQFDIDSATKTSPTRRALYEEGKWTPQSWSILWPRKAMLAWSERHAGS